MLEFFQKSQTFCIVPWIHQELQLNGQVIYCRTQGSHSVADLQNSTLYDSWNSHGLKSIRKTMMAGEIFWGCRKCIENEKYGFTSSRRLGNELYLERFKDYVRSTSPDGSLPEPNIIYFTIKSSNICSSTCRTCNQDNSSAWAKLQEKIHLSDYPPPTFPNELAPHIWDEISRLLPKVELLYFVGGEPLQSSTHFELIEKIAIENPNLTTSYHTNLQNFTLQSKDIRVYWRKFKQIVLSVSIDGVGAVNDYIRNGQSFDLAIKNLIELKKESNISIHIHPTISCYNVFNLPNLLKYFLENDILEVKHGTFIFNRLLEPEHLSLKVIPPEIREKVIQDYKIFIARDLLPNYPITISIHIIRGLNAIIRTLQSEPFSPSLLSEFQHYNRLLNRHMSNNNFPNSWFDHCGPVSHE